MYMVCGCAEKWIEKLILKSDFFEHSGFMPSTTMQNRDESSNAVSKTNCFSVENGYGLRPVREKKKERSFLFLIQWLFLNLNILFYLFKYKSNDIG